MTNQAPQEGQQQAAIVKYTAQDGVEVTLSPAIVSAYIITGGKPASTADVFGFMAKCQARGLNPLAGDAHAAVYGDKLQVIVSKDYFVRNAQAQPDFDGMQAGVTVITPNGELVHREGSLVLQGEVIVGGWAAVYKKSQSHPSKAEVSFKEYSTGKSLWLSKPGTMIRKVALVQALREAYPSSFSGVYDSDEMPEPDFKPSSMPVPNPQVQVETQPQTETVDDFELEIGEE